MSRRKSGPRAEAWLGATQPTGTLLIVLFVPSRDRDGRDIDLGRQANQGEVGIVIGDKYYGITRFDRE